MRNKRVWVGFGVVSVSVLALAKGPLFTSIGAPLTSPAIAKYELSIAGQDQGFVRSPSGGDAITPVIQTKAGAATGRTTYSPIVFKVESPMAHELVTDVQAALIGQSKVLSGQIVTANQDGAAQSIQQFGDALITSVTFPKLDGSSKDSALITVQLTPATVLVKSAGGSTLQSSAATKVSSWLASAFHLNIDGLDTSHVTSVEPIVVTIPALTGSNGTLMAGPVSPTTISFHIPLSDQAGYLTAQKAGAPKNGILTALKSDMKTEIHELRLQGLLITKVSQDGTAQTATVQMVTSHVTFATP